MIYFDNAATTFPKPAAVIREMTKCMREYCGNPGRSSHPLALAASEAIYDVRCGIAEFFGISKPENIIFTYQGDGDLASIGMAETVHAAARNENITIIFVNNAIYGMTGGQMAPTSLPGQVTQTSPYGRDTSVCGFPVRVCEMLSQVDGAEYIERVAVNNVKNIKNAGRAIKKAFENQINGKGFSLIEVISSCPTNWGMTPKKALEWVEEKMIPYYPLGIYKDRSAGIVYGKEGAAK